MRSYPARFLNNVPYNISDKNKVFFLRRGADKSLARLISRCRRTESIALLERGICSCAELQVFSAIEGHFEGKTPREVHQGGLVLARQCPGLPGTCNPEETGLPGLLIS